MTDGMDLGALTPQERARVEAQIRQAEEAGRVFDERDQAHPDNSESASD